MAADGVDPRRADPEGVDVDASAFEDVACGDQRNVLDRAALHQPGRDPGIGGGRRRAGAIGLRAACADRQGEGEP